MKHFFKITALASLMIPASIIIGHSDDPKIRDLQPSYKGKGYKASDPSTALAIGFDSENVQLLSWLTLGDLGGADSGNDCWGYVSPSGREYALIGTSDATAFVEVTNPGDPQVISIKSGPNSLWRDIKTYQHYAYAVSEGGGGIQVFDMENIDNGIVTQLESAGTSNTHNVAIDTTSGFLYRTGGVGSGLMFYDLSNPEEPTYVGGWDEKYVHDAQIVTYTEGPYAGKQIAFCCGGFNGGWSETGLTILDVTNKSNPTILGEVQYSGSGYSHQGWLSEDRKYFYHNDELDEQNGGGQTNTRIFDVEVLENPTFVGSFSSGTSAVDHNLYTHNGKIYEANYRSGLRVFDASDPLNPTPFAYFDTYEENDNASFNGLWSCYPYFPSGTVIGSDLEKGLFVWTVQIPNPCEQPLPQCSDDIDGDGTVGVGDVLAVIDNWGACGDGTFRPTGDVDDNCCVNVGDVLYLISNWGQECVISGSCCLSDFTCKETSQSSCEQVGGMYMGDNSTCETTNCPGQGDECKIAITASLGTNSYETNTATPSSPEPDESQCEGTYLDWDNSSDIWFEWQAEYTGNAYFTTCESSSFDTSMVLYEGDCGNQVTCNGDGQGGNDCQSYYSSFEYNVTEGETYYIRIGGWQGTTGSGILTIE